MNTLTPQGQQLIDNIAQRHGFSSQAVLSMLESVINGNGSMAQFNHPEFSGSGQWMSGGMTMLSDMFNNYLKARVNDLCVELANLIRNQPDLVQTGSFQTQSQNNQQQNTYQNPSNNAPSTANVSLFVAPVNHDWWPSDLRWPNSTGAQNGVRYAYFGQARRLVIEVNGQVTVYDTLDHQIGGFSQQQSYGGSLSFSSQYGLIDVASLPIISVNGIAPAPPQNTMNPPAVNNPAPSVNTNNEQDIFALIDKLADLHNRGVLTQEEFSSKKMELLARF